MGAYRREIGFLGLALILTLLMVAPRPLPVPVQARLESMGGSETVEVLLLMGQRYGAYYNFSRDIMELYGWNLTTTSITPTVDGCYGGGTLAVDTLVNAITDVGRYDCLAIMQTIAYDGASHQELLTSPEALDLVRQAVTDSVLVVAICGGTRVLAAADVINGVHVTGYPSYSQEYLDAGAIWVGGDVPPVLDGNILTAARGHYYCHQICETMRDAINDATVARLGPCGEGE